MYIKDVARKLTPASVKDLIPAYKHRAITRLYSLPISNSGVEEGIPFVKLQSGLIFYGYQPTGVQRYVYKYFVNDKIKATLCEDAFAVAIDILLRYMGPESEGDYIENGKYYDLEKGNTVVECGAYIGYYAMRAAEIVGKSGRVVAIEPIGENLRLLSMNVERNFLHNVTIVPKAVWKEKCVQIIFREAKQRASLKEIVKPGENIRVECDTIDSILDSFHLNQIDFIRIQINGTEIEALKGMTETLRKGPKLLIAAPYRRGGKYSYEEVISILSRNGYSAVRRGGNIFAWNG